MKYKQIEFAKKKNTQTLKGDPNLNYLSMLLCFQILMKKYC